MYGNTKILARICRFMHVNGKESNCPLMEKQQTTKRKQIHGIYLFIFLLYVVLLCYENHKK